MDFIEAFHQEMKEHEVDWRVNGLISPNGNVYSLGSDSKLIGRIFELISNSILQQIADKYGYILKPSDQQTVYPDFTFMKSEDDKEKIAVDIKTTYRTFNKNGEAKKVGFTLGSYASFMRNGTKNIIYPYKEYSKHYVVGFIYTRNDNANEGKIYELDNIEDLEVPYKDVEIFVQEKYKISGEKPGSGNTENIGSFKTSNIDYLVNGEGPFSELGLTVFEHYWAGYPKYRAGAKDYTSLDEYFDFHERKGEDMSSQKRKYNYWKNIHND
ncbi:restriction endonuclease [Candidatus Micrarchaeota archaeon]|nr:restriction endonuclease [Candidatus Micrarchaeota archaeon]